MEAFKKAVKQMTLEQIEELIQFDSYHAARNKDVLLILKNEKESRNVNSEKN